MKVLLIKDVYKLGHAGDVKKVADGFGRNYLIPQGLAILATSGALKQSEGIRSRAAASRQVLNAELGGLASLIDGLTLNFTSKAGETGKLYGSITTQSIAEELSKMVNTQIDRKQVETQPIRTLGEHKAKVRLTMDLTPEIKVVVYREGEAIPSAALTAVEEKVQEEVEASPAADEESAEVEIEAVSAAAEESEEVEVKTAPAADEESAEVEIEAVSAAAEESEEVEVKTTPAAEGTTTEVVEAVEESEEVEVKTAPAAEETTTDVIEAVEESGKEPETSANENAG